MKNLGSSPAAVIVSCPLSVRSMEFCFSSITKYRGSVISGILRLFSCIYSFSVFSRTALFPSSLRNLINGLYLGKPLCARSKRIPPSFLFFESSLASSSLASLKILATSSRCIFTKCSTRGLYSSNIWSSPFGTGPEIIKGVRASSINTESTSSTIAKLCLRCTRSSGLFAMLSLR